MPAGCGGDAAPTPDRRAERSRAELVGLKGGMVQSQAGRAIRDGRRQHRSKPNLSGRKEIAQGQTQPGQ